MTDDYVKRSDVHKAFQPKYAPAINRTFAAMIDSVPAADVREVKRGKWQDAIQGCHDSPHVMCSVCGEYFWQYFKKFNFCPNCGAKMDGGQDDV